MSSVDIFVRYSYFNKVLDKIGRLTNENGLIYRDEGGDFKAHLKTTTKFAILTAASPLIAIARLIRSVAFVCTTKDSRAIREFIGSLATPLVTAICFTGSLLSSIVYVISNGTISFYVQMRRTYAFFEAWINEINLQSSDLKSFSQRTSNATEFFNISNWPKKHVWTTAPCLQPVLEKGYSKKGGLLDVTRMQKMFPLLKVNNIKLEKNNQVVIQSNYVDSDKHYVACNGAYEHRKISETFCCCYRIEMIYDRFFCCEVGKGTCSSIVNSGDSCSIVACSVCGLGACCCYAKEDGKLNAINTGCFGPEAGVFCGTSQ